jgi:hypothetical protein
MLKRTLNYISNNYILNKNQNQNNEIKKCKITQHGYVITLVGSIEAVDIASNEIKQIAEDDYNANVAIITNLNGLVDNMSSLKYNIIINKCYKMEDYKLQHLARFIRDPYWWHPWMFYVDPIATKRYVDKTIPTHVNQVYPLKASFDEKKKDLELYFYLKHL